eukprot:TRINITY_DN1934_c0_g2_i1.p1 TRINITY_DN1934_c0_g2~~TRINITY_DN1934_c0_g2_i1.p1  ORF type:complete len:1724 (-),score=346.37 TRINITY_DN1934_c0_g2_i1:58-5175(-)
MTTDAAKDATKADAGDKGRTAGSGGDQPTKKRGTSGNGGGEGHASGSSGAGGGGGRERSADKKKDDVSGSGSGGGDSSSSRKKRDPSSGGGDHRDQTATSSADKKKGDVSGSGSGGGDSISSKKKRDPSSGGGDLRDQTGTSNAEKKKGDVSGSGSAGGDSSSSRKKRDPSSGGGDHSDQTATSTAEKKKRVDAPSGGGGDKDQGGRSGDDKKKVDGRSGQDEKKGSSAGGGGGYGDKTGTNSGEKKTKKADASNTGGGEKDHGERSSEEKRKAYAVSNGKNNDQSTGEIDGNVDKRKAGTARVGGGGNGRNPEGSEKSKSSGSGGKRRQDEDANKDAVPSIADGERLLKLNSRSVLWSAYRSNSVRTHKYTWYSFIPKNLFLEQFRKQANVYFLVICCLMYLGDHTQLYVGTIKAWSTAGMLAMMMLVSAVVALIDDIRRHLADHATNGRQTVEIDFAGASRTIRWDDVRVGTMLRIKRGEELPADVVALSTSNEDGSCFVSTANLDGETTLKNKVVALPPEFAHRPTLSGVAGKILAEAPQMSIHTFSGTLTLSGRQEVIPLSAKHLLLRGCQLRNVDWVIGFVVYTGPDTREQRNARPAPLKMANIERVINKAMWLAVLMQAVMAALTDATFLNYKDYFRGLWYVYPNGYVDRLVLPDVLAYWLTFFVLYSNLIPISLYATMEVCNWAYAMFISRDPEMTAEGELPARARSTNLCHELGQVSYVFTDKTGTLTQNIMDLRHYFIDASAPISRIGGGGKGSHCKTFNRGEPIHDVTVQGTKQFSFFECLTVAHTVVRCRGGELEGVSPDEEALVGAAKEHGWVFLERKANTVTVQVEGRGMMLRYDLLAVNEFTSSRKRMSVLVRCQATGKHVLFVKGADCNMLTSGQRAPRGITQKREEFDQAIRDFSTRGLRCLVLGRREIDDSVLQPWLNRYRNAQALTVDRERRLMELADEIERDFEVLGVTAVEDKLQEGVGRTMTQLREAGIHVWMLTGDNPATARSIGFSTRVLDTHMRILELSDSRPFRDLLVAYDKWHKERRRQDLALVLTGSALEKISADGSRHQLLKVAMRCSVVIACRLSPLQKAELVSLVRAKAKAPGVMSQPVTLAIGDGANDVPMIHAAQVGVGIYGREGMQAANASDFAIAQFQYLSRLLLVHGRWNYRRSSLVILFTFWRNAVQVILMYLYTYASGFSGTPLFEDSLRITFNLICTIPIVGVGIFDRDVGEDFAKENPAAYEVGRLGLDLNPRKMALTLAHALAHSVILATVVTLALPGLARNGVDDYWSFCTLTYTMLVVGVNFQAGYLATTWNVPTVLFQAGAAALYVFALMAYNDVALEMPHKYMYNVPKHVFDAPMVPACIFVGVTFQYGFDLMLAHFSRAVANFRRSPRVAADDSGTYMNDAHEEEDGDAPCWSMQAVMHQRLAGLQIGRGSKRTSALFFLIGVALGSLAYHFRAYGEGVEAFRIEYDTHCDVCFWLEDMRTFVHHCPVGGGPVAVDVTVPYNIPAPVDLIYAVTPFYQNFNEALKEKNFPNVVVSQFNDTFSVTGASIKRTSIAWRSDKEVLEKLGSKSAEDEALAVWARPGAVPVLHKRYGTLVDSGHGTSGEAPAFRGLVKGENITVTIDAHFPVDSFGGNKALVLASMQNLSGVSFGRMLFAGSILSVLLGFIAGCGSWCLHFLLCSNRVYTRGPHEQPLLPSEIVV